MKASGVNRPLRTWCWRRERWRSSVGTYTPTRNTPPADICKHKNNYNDTDNFLLNFDCYPLHWKMPYFIKNMNSLTSILRQYGLFTWGGYLFSAATIFTNLTSYLTKTLPSFDKLYELTICHCIAVLDMERCKRHGSGDRWREVRTHPTAHACRLYCCHIDAMSTRKKTVGKMCVQKFSVSLVLSNMESRHCCTELQGLLYPVAERDQHSKYFKHYLQQPPLSMEPFPGWPHSSQNADSLCWHWAIPMLQKCFPELDGP